MILNGPSGPRQARGDELEFTACAGHEGPALLFRWRRDQAYALDWAHHEGELWRDWQRTHAQGPDWWHIADYHRYGWAARQKYPDRAWEAVRCGFWRGYAAGIWATRDPWGEIEEAIRHGWERAGDTAPSTEAAS